MMDLTDSCGGPTGSVIRDREVSGTRRVRVRVRTRQPGDHAVGYCRRPFR